MASDLLSDEDEAMVGIPRLRLPTGFEIIEPRRRAVPSFFAFDQTPEGGKALDRRRNGEFNLRRMQLLDYGSVEEGTVDAGLDLLRGEGISVLGSYGG